ncbi:MAG TPA: class I SAM-dependent methyltransferase [Caulobacteraceae bacterium]
MQTPLDDARLEALLDELHARSSEQEEHTRAYFARRAAEGTLSWKGMDEETHGFLADKLVALDRDKALFCHQLCRAIDARTVVEVGTSCGVSTLYLAAAVRANAVGGGRDGLVIGTEHEPTKAAAARALFERAGLASLIELREGDLRETLKSLEGPIDFVLFDIWVEMARPALELIAPHLRRGSVLVADNTAAVPGPYADYFAFLKEPPGRFSTITLPFEGGLEMTVRGN